MERVLHFFVVFTLPMIKFGHAQISVPKTDIPMLKTACINPCYLQKKDHLNKENYWPVSLLSHMSMVFERLLHKQIEIFINKL